MRLTKQEQEILNIYRELNDSNKIEFNTVVKFLSTATEQDKADLLKATGIDLSKSLTDKQAELLEQYALSKAEADKDFYTIKEAAGVIGVTYRTCLEYIRTGKIPAHKVVGKWAIDASDLKAFIR